jgi:two-component system NarL family sensor kinase
LQGAANVNVVTCSRLQWLADGTEGLRYHASIPIYSHENKLGVMNLASTDWRELGPDDLKLLYTIGYQLGIAVERARLYARIALAAKIEERNRLAREIHDTLAQGLTAISWQLESADALIAATPERAKENIAKALELTRLNLEEARRSVLDLRAVSLLDRSLPEAVRHLSEQIAREHGLSIEVHVEDDQVSVPARVAAGIYRIIQEALNNIVRHAYAQQVTIALYREDDGLYLSIEDDGVGFDPQVASNGFGLVGMRERAHLFNGVLDVESEPGHGTRIVLAVMD